MKAGGRPKRRKPVRYRAKDSRSLTRRSLSVFAEVLITLGLVLVLFVVYQFWWTNVTAGQLASKAQIDLRQAWRATSTPAPEPTSFSVGDPIGVLHVPAMGKDFTVVVKEGTTTGVLNEGVAGHYTSPVESALPWEGPGNFALAAHRDGHGAKFHNIDKLKPGDTIVLETERNWYIYQVDRTLPKTSKTDVGTIAAVPAKAGYTEPGHYITLTSCTPVFTSLYRIIVWGHLVDTLPTDPQHFLPAALL
ncbi:class E sortase (plasmid) [Kitasatospora sp. NBC_00070]|uniref:class E sortase n=1 Tax=Kitasatospora sp. NBC_00070 TaxID=2975962 RepID=UPI002F90E7ED